MANKAQEALAYLGLVDLGAQPRSRDRVAAPRPEVARASAPRPTVTPIRSSFSRRNEPAYASIHTARPRTYVRDAENIAYWFREGSPVVVDLSTMPEADVRRIIDFMSGLVAGLEGTIRKVATKVFMLTPAGIEQFDDESDQNGLHDGFDDLAV